MAALCQISEICRLEAPSAADRRMQQRCTVPGCRPASVFITAIECLLGFDGRQSEQLICAAFRSPARPGLSLVAAPGWRALNQEFAMTLTAKQQATLTQAAGRSDGLAGPPAHLPARPRAPVARALLAAGLAVRVKAAEAELDVGWKLDGQVIFLRISDAGRQAIGAAVGVPDARSDSGDMTVARAGEMATSGIAVSEAAEPPVEPPDTSKRPKLRQAAAALLTRWDETTEREPLADRIADLRAALSLARPAGPLLRRQGDARPAAKRRAAGGNAHRLMLEIAALQTEGFDTRQSLARELTARGVPTPRDGAVWTHTTVARLLARAEGEQASA